jgi:hypothetical protein
MHEIIAGQLWIGNAGDVRDPARLLDAGVAAVLNLAAEEQTPALPRSLIYCHFPIMDGEQEVDSALAVAIGTLVWFQKYQVPTMVYCSAGMSRTPAIVAAALSLLEGRSPDEKLREIAAGHPHDVSPRLWEEVRRVCGEMRFPAQSAGN